MLRKGRWYWEPPLRLRQAHGLKVAALGGDHAAAWAIARDLNKRFAQLEEGAPVPGSVAWLFAQFFATEKFGTLAASTQRDYRMLARRIGALEVANQPIGRYPARAIKARHADALHAMLAEASGEALAHYACRVARRVWKWGARREHVDHANPWAGMELRSLPQRTQTWQPEHVAAFVAKAAEKGKASLGLAVQIAYWLGLRRTDVLALTPLDLRRGWVETSKTRTRVPLPVAEFPELAAALAGVPEDAAAVVICEATGLPWNPHTFGHEFRDLADQAGIPRELQFRDLRATSATEAADGGADVIQLRTQHGWRTTQMAARYARPTQAQAQAAAAARHRGRKRTGDE